MPDAWYYSTQDEQVGPITLQELKETLPALPNAKDVYIWHDSLPEWIRAGDLAEFVARKSGFVQKAEPHDKNDNNLDSQDAPTGTDTQLGLTPLDELHLDELHPDLAYAITMPDLTPEDTGNAANVAKGQPVIGLLVSAVLFLFGFGLVGLRLVGALPRASSAFALAGALMLVAGVVVLWFGRSKTPDT